MKIMEVLQKLGIVRYGVKSGGYTGMQDRPAELFMEGVFNADKDLTTKGDWHRVAAAAKSLGGRKAFCWISLVLGAFALLFLATASGLTAWFFADLILWGAFIALLRQFAFAGRYSFKAMIILLVVLVVVSLMFLGATVPSD